MSAAFRATILALFMGGAGAAQAQTWPLQEGPVADQPDGTLASHQEAEAYAATGRASTFGTASPSFWLAVHDRKTLQRRMISFHRVQSPSGGPTTWVARRRAAGLSDIETLATSMLDCPALEAVIAGARTLPPPMIDLPGPPAQERSPYEDVNITMDDDTYAFGAGALFAPNDALGLIQFSGGSNSAVGVWGQAAEDALAPCWRPLEEVRVG